MATWPHISAKNKTDVLQEGLHTGSAGGTGFPSRGSRNTGGRASRTALAKTPCVEGGTHPGFHAVAGGENGAGTAALPEISSPLRSPAWLFQSAPSIFCLRLARGHGRHLVYTGSVFPWRAIGFPIVLEKIS